jgi:hypothetical protein
MDAACPMFARQRIIDADSRHNQYGMIAYSVDQRRREIGVLGQALGLVILGAWL